MEKNLIIGDFKILEYVKFSDAQKISKFLQILDTRIVQTHKKYE